MPCAFATCARTPYDSAVSVDSSDSTWMSAMTTSAPARASASASARPRPREPPVTSATRPERSISMAMRRSYVGTRAGCSGSTSRSGGPDPSPPPRGPPPRPGPPPPPRPPPPPPAPPAEEPPGGREVEDRLLERGIVLLGGHLDQAAAQRAAARLMLLDA